MKFLTELNNYLQFANLRERYIKDNKKDLERYAAMLREVKQTGDPFVALKLKELRWQLINSGGDAGYRFSMSIDVISAIERNFLLENLSEVGAKK